MESPLSIANPHAVSFLPKIFFTFFYFYFFTVNKQISPILASSYMMYFLITIYGESCATLLIHLLTINNLILLPKRTRYVTIFFSLKDRGLALLAHLSNDLGIWGGKQY